MTLCFSYVSRETETPVAQPEDESVKKFLDNVIEDIQIPEVEFAVGGPENGENEINKTEKEETMDITSPDDDDKDSAEVNLVEGGDTVTEIPEIAGALDRRGKSFGRRVSTGTKEMDQYLKGYGEDYGSKSSTTDLEQEGLKYYKEREIKKKVAARDREKRSRDSSPTKTPDEEENYQASPKQKSKNMFRFSKFVRKKKKRTLEVAEPGENDHQSHKEVAAMEHAPTVPQIVVEAPRVNGERDSIAVNTSLGGTDSEDTLVDDAAADRVKGHVRLPLESQPVSDRVRLLQESVKEHHSEDVTTEVGTESIQCHDHIQLYYTIPYALV